MQLKCVILNPWEQNMKRKTWAIKKCEWNKKSLCKWEIKNNNELPCLLYIQFLKKYWTS